MMGGLDREGRKLRRQGAETHGRRSEILAALWLSCKFYRVLGRRVKTHLGELDLVAMSPAGILAFVEVKARALGRCRRSDNSASALALSAPLRFTWARVPSYATKLSDSTPY